MSTSARRRLRWLYDRATSPLTPTPGSTTATIPGALDALTLAKPWLR
ncbi:hypothetical protein [Nonomuraea soli]|uniref:Uncharacterized protein n=1 Tax=Nonomuraea soli TaxID=1032476 RepID=A0A7W0CLS0_9ACTN|nr:hypothetical protein [Nonomuraea soli]MBA2893297.1 hypothetical protein [Nonomuraea soli]